MGVINCDVDQHSLVLCSGHRGDQSGGVTPSLFTGGKRCGPLPGISHQLLCAIESQTSNLIISPGSRKPDLPILSRTRALASHVYHIPSGCPIEGQISHSSARVAFPLSVRAIESQISHIISNLRTRVACIPCYLCHREPDFAFERHHFEKATFQLCSHFGRSTAALGECSGQLTTSYLPLDKKIEQVRKNVGLNDAKS